GGQYRVDLVMGDVAALLGGANELLDSGVGKVEQRQRGVWRLGGLLFRRLVFFFLFLRCLGLARHTSSPGDGPVGERQSRYPYPRREDGGVSGGRRRGRALEGLDSHPPSVAGACLSPD